MKSHASFAMAAVLGLAVCSSPLAQGLSRADYLQARKDIESDFRSARAGCEPMVEEHVRAICMADVRGREAVALAELRVAYEPTDEALMEVRILKARAGLAVARARCVELPAHRKAACAAEAEAAHGVALAPPANTSRQGAAAAEAGGSKR